MRKKIAIGAVVFALILIIIGCSAPTSAALPAQKPAQTPASAPSTPTVIPTPPPPPAPTPKPSGPIKAKWIDPQVSGTTVSIPVSEVKNSWNIHFKVATPSGTETVMAYMLDGELYVRASICPPCRGISYSLVGDILDCDTCGTTFKAKTGAGIKGPCVNYPKAAVQYKIVDTNMVMNINDIINAYQETLKPG